MKSLSRFNGLKNRSLLDEYQILSREEKASNGKQYDLSPSAETIFKAAFEMAKAICVFPSFVCIFRAARKIGAESQELPPNRNRRLSLWVGLAAVPRSVPAAKREKLGF